MTLVGIKGLIVVKKYGNCQFRFSRGCCYDWSLVVALYGVNHCHY